MWIAVGMSDYMPWYQKFLLLYCTISINSAITGVGGGLSKFEKLAGYQCLCAKKEKKS